MRPPGGGFLHLLLRLHLLPLLMTDRSAANCSVCVSQISSLRSCLTLIRPAVLTHTHTHTALLSLCVSQPIAGSEGATDEQTLLSSFLSGEGCAVQLKHCTRGNLQFHIFSSAAATSFPRFPGVPGRTSPLLANCSGWPQRNTTQHDTLFDNNAAV